MWTTSTEFSTISQLIVSSVCEVGNSRADALAERIDCHYEMGKFCLYKVEKFAKNLREQFDPNSKDDKMPEFIPNKLKKMWGGLKRKRKSALVHGREAS